MKWACEGRHPIVGNTHTETWSHKRNLGEAGSPQVGRITKWGGGSVIWSKGGRGDLESLTSFRCSMWD